MAFNISIMAGEKAVRVTLSDGSNHVLEPNAGCTVAVGDGVSVNELTETDQTGDVSDITDL